MEQEQYDQAEFGRKRQALRKSGTTHFEAVFQLLQDNPGKFFVKGDICWAIGGTANNWTNRENGNGTINEIYTTDY